MSTIVIDVREKVVYADTQGSINDRVFCGTVEISKILHGKTKNVVLGGVGSYHDFVRFAGSYGVLPSVRTSSTESVLLRVELIESQLLVTEYTKDKGLFSSRWKSRTFKPLTNYLVYGSGGKLALTALMIPDVTPIQALKATSKVDVYTNSIIHTLPLGEYDND